MSTDHTVTARYDTVFHHAYAVEQPDLRRLYEQAKRDQWNVSRDIDWSRPVDLDSAVVADELIDIYLLYGEHGAMLACSQLVETVSGPDAKYFVATQVVDEARHTEVIDRYLRDKLGGLTYPMPQNERELFDTILSDSRWYVKTIALQLVAETFAVSLFRMLAETSKDELLREICRFILRDESRHMGFGMLSLPSTIAQLSESERREVEEFTCWSLGKVLTGLFPTEVYQEMGFSPAEINEIQHVRKARAVGGESSFFRQTFKKDLHGTLVQNLARIGVLTDRVRPKLESLGIRVPAHIG